MMSDVIDFHVHHYPTEVLEDPVSWATARGEYYWASLVGPQPGGKPSIQGRATTEKLIAAMDAAGVARAVMQGWYWQDQSTCNLHNDFQAQCLREHPDRLLAFASVQPRHGLDVLDDLKRAYDAGHCGVGEVFHKAQGFSIKDPVWLAVVEWAVTYQLPILMHVSEPVGHTYPGKLDSPFKDYQWLAATYPELKLVLAHWGGLMPFYELNPEFKKIAHNIYYDTAASPLIYSKDVYKAVVGTVGEQKILFGSDYPLRLYPGLQKEPDMLKMLHEVNNSGLSQAQLQAILYQNAQTLLNK